MADVKISLQARDELDSLGPPAPERIRSKLLDEAAERPDRHLVRLQIPIQSVLNELPSGSDATMSKR